MDGIPFAPIGFVREYFNFTGRLLHTERVPEKKSESSSPHTHSADLVRVYVMCVQRRTEAEHRIRSKMGEGGNGVQNKA